MEISYYELLGMVQEGKAPERIEVKICNRKSAVYKADYDGAGFNYYYIENKKEEDEDYQGYLTECFLESMMFDKCITILDEEDEFEDIEEITCMGEKIELGTMVEWLGSTLNDNEAKICSAMECFGRELNKVIKNQKKIIERLKDENKRI